MTDTDRSQCPSCGEPMEVGYVRPSKPWISLVWSKRPTTAAALLPAGRARGDEWLARPFVGDGNSLAASRCQRCRVISMKYEP